MRTTFIELACMYSAIVRDITWQPAEKTRKEEGSKIKKGGDG